MSAFYKPQPKPMKQLTEEEQLYLQNLYQQARSKTMSAVDETINTDVPLYDSADDVQDPLAALESLDFNVEEEFRPDPLVPNGTYNGSISSAAYKADKFCLVMYITLNNNEGIVMSDGETPVDGRVLPFNIWIPKPGDEHVMTASGSMSKRQSKINSMKRLEDKVGIKLSPPSVVAAALRDQSWVGTPVYCKVGMSEYQGVTRNEINSISAAPA